ncbi:hypothetical protein M527_07245 [Sphingobium indicum IP26]|uniref:Uncharacterized protein n=1 Tax=Sphingobium indicum F2 TaxID=1450518 RepID=A0A8E0WSP9_9SPHN|nr:MULTISPECIES: hypothetical protein [Sphingobium]EPR09912.1 hypothetical protein M527_07245 [Sphingobium indicum IP26]KER36704.1 hypothetical protein AL00_09540 [Sphingobium indicum F2]
MTAQISQIDDVPDLSLPAGKTCGDCFHIRRCKAMFGHVETDTYCDWYPIRFRAAPEEGEVTR